MSNEFFQQQGKNFAPVKPLIDLRDASDVLSAEKAVKEHNLTKALREIYDERIRRDSLSWRSIVAAGQINALFIQGEQILRLNTYTGMPRIETPDRSNPSHIKAINKMQHYASQMQAKWMSSRPDILVEPLSNEDAAVAQARNANAVCDYLEREWFNHWFNTDEGLNAQIWGWYGRQVVPDYTAKNFSTFREILGEKRVPIGKAYGRCECGYKGDDAKDVETGGVKFPSCPQCGSLEYQFEPAIEALIETVVGREQVFLPEIVCRPLNLAATRWDMSRKFEESSWAIIERTVELGVIRQMLGNVVIPEGESGNAIGLDTLDLIARRGAALNGISESATQKRDTAVLTEMYLSPEDLWDVVCGTEEKTVDGGTLPKGKRASDVFKRGATVYGINGMALIVGIYHGTHHDSTASGVFHKKASSGLGRGIDDAVEIQKQFNRRYSQIDRFMAARATPPILTPENGIEPRFRRMFSKPDAVIPVKLQNFPEIRNINQLVAPMQGESVPGDLLHVTFDRLEALMQNAYHILTFAGGNPRANNKTATGAEILESNADELLGPILALKAECNLNTVRKGFYKWVEATPTPRFVRFKSRTKGGRYGIEISGKDVEGEYYWSYVEGSEQPKNRHTENQKKIAFFGLFGGVQNYLMAKQTAPAEVAELERVFDVDFETADYDQVAESCRVRLESAFELLAEQGARAEASAMQGVSASPDYNAIIAALNPAPLPIEAKLVEKATWFQSLLDSEEGLSFKPAERELVAALVLTFQDLAKIQAAKLQRDAAEVQMAAQAPMQEAQAQQQAAAAEQQAAAEAAAREEGAVAEGLQTLAANAESEAQRESDERVAMEQSALRREEMSHESEQNAEQRLVDLAIAERGAANGG